MTSRLELLQEIEALRSQNNAMRNDMRVMAEKFQQLLKFLDINPAEMDKLNQRQIMGMVVKKTTSLGTMAMVNPKELDRQTSFLNDIGPTIQNIMKYIEYDNNNAGNTQIGSGDSNGNEGAKF